MVAEGQLTFHSPSEAPPAFPPFPAAGAWEGPVPVAPSTPIASLARVVTPVAEAARPCGSVPEAQGLLAAGRGFTPGPMLALFPSRGTRCCGSRASRTRRRLRAGGSRRLRPGLGSA